MLGGHVCPRSLEERRNSEEGEQGEEQRRWGKVTIRHDTGGRPGVSRAALCAARVLS